ncbi:uncharacterized protein LOC121719988 isoform X2 [Alosa sapidissima]|uniref:uncharacterized protein LOC121719988 isoform X2 n=1 Tax=Alosa sapidissima TaxID=34773 RepID=UPI001C08EAAB|nr:uncharacterized protein LOC121719988 isoform X2 [Alosa sapidissima]
MTLDSSKTFTRLRYWTWTVVFLCVSLQSISSDQTGLICDEITSNGTTKCCVSNVPQHHLNNPDCEQNWFRVKGNKPEAIAMYPESWIDVNSTATAVTHNCLIVSSPQNLTWKLTCGSEWIEYSASYVIAMSVIIPLVLITIAVVAFFGFRKCKERKRIQQPNSELNDNFLTPPLANSCTTRQQNSAVQTSGTLALATVSVNGTQSQSDPDIKGPLLEKVVANTVSGILPKLQHSEHNGQLQHSSTPI